MPQLAQLALVYQSQWFWLLLVLGAIYLFVGRGIVPKVEATVDDRDAKIAADLAEAERLRADGRPTLPSTIAAERATNPFMRAGDAEELGRRRAAKDGFKA